MLKFELIENTKEIISYRYFPDGSNVFGVISVAKKSKDIIALELSKNDSFRRYFYHMYSFIKESIEKNTFKETGIVAWY